MATKLYCVLVTEVPFEYCLEAENSTEAQERVIARFWTDREIIARVEVLRVCACGYANKADAKVCPECRTEL